MQLFKVYFIYENIFVTKAFSKAETCLVKTTTTKIPSIPNKAVLVTETEERGHIFHLSEIRAIQNDSSKRTDLFFRTP